LEINQYSKKHKLAIEGSYDSSRDMFDALTATINEYARNDNISHFICRLAYCRNEELRRWFLTQETRLFHLRL
jgi:DNA primase large subunit